MAANWFEYIWLPVLFALLFIFFNSYYALLALFIVVLIPLLALALLLCTYRKVRLDLTEAPRRQEGREIIYSLANSSVFPVVSVRWELIMENHLTGAVIRQMLHGAVGGNGRERIRLKLEQAATGQIIFHTADARVYDFLRLFSFKITSPEPQSVLIYPRILPVHLLPSERIEAYGEGMRYAQNKIGADVNEIYALHEYVAGDELRKIHWKLSSKTDELIVRDFGLALNHPITLLLELATDERNRGAEHLSVCLDAFFSLSTVLLQRGLAHNIVWFDRENETLRLEEATDLAALQMFLPEILTLSTYSGQPNAMQYYGQSLTAASGTLLFYVTSIITPESLAVFASKHTLKIIYAGDLKKYAGRRDELMDRLEIVSLLPDDKLIAELII